MEEAHPDVPIVTAAVDSHLNSHGYIVPGLEMPEIECTVQNNEISYFEKYLSVLVGSTVTNIL